LAISAFFAGLTGGDGGGYRGGQVPPGAATTLSLRARRVLVAVVTEFIATGEPVASAALARRPGGNNLSSASIRAIFAELETEGYLSKPHSSAGRVPTERAWRHFAEALLQTTSATSTERTTELDRRYAEVPPGLDALMRFTGRVLSELTGVAAVVLPPRSESWELRDLRFVWLRPTELLAVIVATTGAVQNRVMRVDEALSTAEVERVNNVLQARIQGRTLPELREAFARELEAGDDRGPNALARRALAMGQAALDKVIGAEVVVEGTAQLLERPEFASVDRTRQAVRTLEDHALIVKLLDRTLASPGLQVLIGSAAPETGIGGDLSLVAANFGSGAVGVIGSTRMDYPAVMPLVRHAAQHLRGILRPRNRS
jgi:heat-inducible transcriptional repressor